ncbi:MAG: DUF3126 family protein [Pseudomonadota bacterium]
MFSQSEIDSLTEYLGKVFNTRELMVLQHPEEDDQALVAIGQAFFAHLERDEDEGELSYNLTKEVPDQPYDEMVEHMRGVFNGANVEVRKRTNKTDSTEIYKEDEFLGVLYDDDGNADGMQVFNMAILEFDLHDGDEDEI